MWTLSEFSSYMDAYIPETKEVKMNYNQITFYVIHTEF